MQGSSSPLTPDNQKVARRVGRIVLLLYSSAVLVLTTWVMLHISPRNPTTAQNSIDAVAMPKESPVTVTPVKTFSGDLRSDVKH
jgi:hypothetical protein